MVVLVQENPAADIVAARIFIRAGSRWETAQEAGLSHLVSAVLTKGADHLSSLEIAEQVESLGASLGTDSTTDYFLLSLKTVAADFEIILHLAGQLLRSPTFPESELDLERRLTLQAIRSQQEQPFSVAYDQLRQVMYKDHPYALSGLGTETVVAQLTQDDLCRYHQLHFRPDNIIISICGNIRQAAAIALIEKVFGDWQAPALALPSLTLPAVPSQPTQVTTPQDTQQSVIMLGYLTPAVAATAPALEEYAALKLVNSYLGNGLSSRLFVELREKRGLAYDVSGFYPTRLDTAQFVVYIGTAPSNTLEALHGLQTEVERLQTIHLKPEELQATKNKILGQYALGKQTNAQLAQLYGWYETLGLGIDFDQQFQNQIQLVTGNLVQSVVNQYLMAPYLSVVGPTAALELLDYFPRAEI